MFFLFSKNIFTKESWGSYMNKYLVAHLAKAVQILKLLSGAENCLATVEI